MDSTSGQWTNLWRQDEWAMDKGDPYWTQNPAGPVAYSESDLSPLQLQLYPAPVNSGMLDGLTVDSVERDLTNPNSTFQIPDEWIHAIKYAALSNILSGGMINDDLRQEYSEMRYSQAITFARNATSILRVACNAMPLNIDSLASLDAGEPFWRNQVGAPIQVGAMYDMLTVSPGSPDQAYSITADVVQSAPIPTSPFDPTTFFIPMGPEDLDTLVDYVCHVLLFKCGGKDFKETMSGYDGFMKAASNRMGINKAKVQYFAPLFQVAQKEWNTRRDRVESNA
jgi:hypothetical protein